MTQEKVDKRVQRTRQLLRQALMQLVQEKGYDNVTIQDITDRANVGRTTFYLHYPNKDELLLDHHDDLSNYFQMTKLTPEEILASEPSPGFVTFLEHLARNRAMYFVILRSRDADSILQRIMQQVVQNLEETLGMAFPNAQPLMPLDVLASYLVGAQFAMVRWWFEQRPTYSAQQIAAMLHELEKNTICHVLQTNAAP